MGLWSSKPTFNNPPKFNNLDEVQSYLKVNIGKIAQSLNEIAFALNGTLDSRNTREIGGWKVSLTELESKEKDVGMSTEDTPGDDVRFWAGGSNKNTAPWRVTESGKMVATGALIQSSDGYPKVVLDPADDLIGAYTSADESIVINAFDGVEQKPFMEYTDHAESTTVNQNDDQFKILSSGEIIIQNANGKDIFLQPSGTIWVNDTGKLFFFFEGDTLANLLAAKASLGNQTEDAGPFNGGIAPGTKLATTSDGVTIDGFVTWVGIAAHSHTQT